MINSFLKRLGVRTGEDELKQTLVAAIEQGFGYITLDHQAQITGMNTSLEHTFTPGTDVFGLLEGGDQFKSAQWVSISSGQIADHSFRLINDRQTCLQLKFCPIQKDHGEVTQVIVFCEDISRQKEVLEELEAIKKAIDVNYAYIKFDVDGKVLDANDVFVKTLGYTTRSEIIGRHHSIFVSSSDKASNAYQQFWERLRSGEIQQGTFRRINKSGGEVWIEAAYSPIKDSQGKVESIVKIAVDYTDEKVSNDRLTDIKSTIDSSFGYIQFDPEGLITDVNVNFVDLMGYANKSEVVGRHHSMFVDSEEADSDAYRTFWKALKQGHAQKGEFGRLTKSGQRVWIQAAYTPLTDANGTVTSVIKIAADITSKVLASQEAKDELRTQVLENLKEISTSISQIASGSRDQAIKTDLASSLIEKSLQTSTDVGSRARNISDMANSAAMEAQVGESTVSELTRAMSRLNNVASDSEKRMKHFMDHTKEINQVLKVIKEISSQTNLLALNASIEAAQAGDYGRGFAVIAKEVRDLSDNSRKSTQQIEDLIRNVQENSLGVATAMREVSDQVVEGLSVVTNVTNIFKKMSESTTETSQVSGDILKAADLQMAGMHELVKSIESIVVIAEQTAAGAEEVSSASQTLEAEIGRY